MHCLRDLSNRFSNNRACRGRFSIVDGHGFEFILRGAMEVECKPSSKHLVGKIKNKDDLLTLRSCASTRWRPSAGACLSMCPSARLFASSSSPAASSSSSSAAAALRPAPPLLLAVPGRFSGSIWQLNSKASRSSMMRTDSNHLLKRGSRSMLYALAAPCSNLI